MRLSTATVGSVPTGTSSDSRPASPPRYKSRITPACLDAPPGPVSPPRSTVNRHGLRSTATVYEYGRGNVAHPCEVASTSRADPGAGPGSESGSVPVPHRSQLPGCALRGGRPLTGAEAVDRRPDVAARNDAVMYLSTATVVALLQCSDSGFRPASPPRSTSRIALVCLEAHPGSASPPRSTVNRHGLRSTAPAD